MSCWQFEALEKVGGAAAVLVVVAATLAVVGVVAGDAALDDVLVALDPHPAVIAAAATRIADIALMFTNSPFSRPVSERSILRYYA
jgi:hypothetical protein